VLPPEEDDFRWIAELGLQSPLPPRWSACYDPSTSYTYFVDNDRGLSFWENPLLPSLQRVVEVGRLYLQSPSDEFFEKYKMALYEEQMAGLKAWHGPFTDFAGRPSYVNTETGVISTQDPRIDAQYLFELQSSFLDTMQEVHVFITIPETPGSNWGSPTGPLLSDWAEPDQSPPSSPTRKKNWMARLREQSKVVDHASLLQEMRGQAARLVAICEDEEEVQRLKISEKCQARKARKMAPEALAQVDLGQPDLLRTLGQSGHSLSRGPSFGPGGGLSRGPSFGPGAGGMLSRGPSFGPGGGLSRGPSFGPGGSLSKGPSRVPTLEDDEPAQDEMEELHLQTIPSESSLQMSPMTSMKGRRAPMALAFDQDDESEKEELPPSANRPALPKQGLPSPANFAAGALNPEAPGDAPPAMPPQSPSLRKLREESAKKGRAPAASRAEAFLASKVRARLTVPGMVPGTPCDLV